MSTSDDKCAEKSMVQILLLNRNSCNVYDVKLRVWNCNLSHIAYRISAFMANKDDHDLFTRIKSGTKEKNLTNTTKYNANKSK